MTINEVCPKCSTPVETPSVFRSGPAQTPQAHRKCPGCGERLVWFRADPPLGIGWRIDDTPGRT